MINQLKTLIFLGILTVILLFIGKFIAGTTGLTVAFIFVLLMNFFAYWYSDKIVLAMYKAKPLPKTSWLYNEVEKLASKAKIPVPKLYLIDAQQPNAFATGRNPKHASIAVTSGLMELLSKEEIYGVIAHEISHIKNRDTLISCIAAVIAGTIAYVAMLARWAAIFGMAGRDERNADAFALLALAIVTPLAATLTRLAISRAREYLADETGAKLIGSPVPLANALSKLESASRHVSLKGNPATAHMFIVNPFSGKALLELFSTHPNTENRIKRLLSLKI